MDRATDLVVASAPHSRAGSAAALSETSGELGVALGIAIMGTLLTAVYRLRLDSALPASASPDVRAAADEGLPAAERAAGKLHPSAGEAVLEGARVACGAAFSTVAYVCAGITVALGAVAVLGMRRARQSGCDVAG